MPSAGAAAAVRNQHLLSTQRHRINSKTVKDNKGTGDSQHAFVKNVSHQTNFILLYNGQMLVNKGGAVSVICFHSLGF